MSDPLATISTRTTPQSEPADSRQVPNSADGYTFAVGDMARLRRFLVLGTTGGTYYISERDLTRDTAGVVLDLARERGSEVVDEVLAVSTAGRAPRQNPALFALAAVMGLGDADARTRAGDVLPQVARTGTHLFIFARYVEQFRGWGRGLRTSVANWYLGKSVDDLAYQVVKYRQREGWSHRDLLRLSHPISVEDDRRALFNWICGRQFEGFPPLVEGFARAQFEDADIPALIREYGLTWEMLPPESLNDPTVWSALLEKGLPQTALMRQLPRLTRLGLLGPMSVDTSKVAAQLADPQRLVRARVHPMNVLVALRTYASGQSARGDGTWTAVREIVDALDAAFYAAFGAVEPSGKRTLLALDVSGSMGSPVSGLPLSCREASAALALVTASVEPQYQIVGFTSASGGYWNRDSAITPLAISPRQRLDDAIRAVSGLPFGGTDCSLPMSWALENRVEVDTFVIITDNETWAGREHPHQALTRYREKMGIQARQVVIGMTATDFTIADPTDPGTLDVVGFDTATPNLISDFSRGLV